LLEATKHLTGCVLRAAQDDSGLLYTYAFLRDRLRQVKKDLVLSDAQQVQQNKQKQKQQQQRQQHQQQQQRAQPREEGEEVATALITAHHQRVEILERIVLFYLVTFCVFQGDTSGVFDAIQHKALAVDVCERLLLEYKSNDNTTAWPVSPRQRDFLTLIMTFYLGSSSISMLSFFTAANTTGNAHQPSTEFKETLMLWSAFRADNGVIFHNQTKALLESHRETKNLFGTVAWAVIQGVHVHKIRLTQVNMMRQSYSPRGYLRLSSLTDRYGFISEDHTRLFLELFELKIQPANPAAEQPVMVVNVSAVKTRLEYPKHDDEGFQLYLQANAAICRTILIQQTTLAERDREQLSGRGEMHEALYTLFSVIWAS
jgi:hypothetical protein